MLFPPLIRDNRSAHQVKYLVLRALLIKEREYIELWLHLTGVKCYHSIVNATKNTEGLLDAASLSLVRCWFRECFVMSECLLFFG
ncbi:hypothetical protein SAMN05428964_11219 [Thalassospira xiamenensis]|uniref:Uncharacterized protein n=1 Tax=Thalassospira xiamenensis TaxID=220697 RepID=A0A285TYC1_9PROT|nr:hypothetical protein SAMN05428964_11219 [Thalassospira xiamenensis]